MQIKTMILVLALIGVLVSNVVASECLKIAIIKDVVPGREANTAILIYVSYNESEKNWEISTVGVGIESYNSPAKAIYPDGIERQVDRLITLD